MTKKGGGKLEGELTEPPKEEVMVGVCEETLGGLRETQRRLEKEPNFMMDSMAKDSQPENEVEVLEEVDIFDPDKEIEEIKSEAEKVTALDFEKVEEIEFLPTETRALLGPKVEKILLALLESLIATGVDVGWDNRSHHLKKKFSEMVVEQGDLATVVRILELPREEACVICNFLRKTVPLMGEKDEEAVRDAILRIIFPHCCFE